LVSRSSQGSKEGSEQYNMIEKEKGAISQKDGMSWLACRLKGSVIPKALMWAVPLSIASAFVNFSFRELLADDDFSMRGLTLNVLLSCSVGLVLLLVLRSYIAITRFWHGISHLQTVRASWLNVCSSCFAFCTEEDEKQLEVRVFQHYFLKLMSVMHGSALQACSQYHESAVYEILDLTGIDKPSLEWLMGQPNKPEIVMQWIQRLIIQSQRSGVIDVDSAILSRVFHSLEEGIKDLSGALRMNLVSFPCHFAQIIWSMLCLHGVCTCFLSGIAIDHPAGGAVVTFLVSFLFWTIHYATIEVEHPYSITRSNSLPMSELQVEMNQKLKALLDPHMRRAPAFSWISNRLSEVSIHSGDPIVRSKTIRTEVSSEEDDGDASDALEQPGRSKSKNSQGSKASWIGEAAMDGAVRGSSEKRGRSNTRRSGRKRGSAGMPENSRLSEQQTMEPTDDIDQIALTVLPLPSTFSPRGETRQSSSPTRQQLTPRVTLALSNLAAATTLSTTANKRMSNTPSRKTTRCTVRRGSSLRAHSLQPTFSGGQDPARFSTSPGMPVDRATDEEEHATPSPSPLMARASSKGSKGLGPPSRPSSRAASKQQQAAVVEVERSPNRSSASSSSCAKFETRKPSKNSIHSERAASKNSLQAY
jgi:predicted membrane chloride channel (bestrophin family)